MKGSRSRDMGRRVAENAPTILAYLDRDLRILFVNRHCRSLLGYAPAELVGRALADVVDPGTMRYARGHAAKLEHSNRECCEYVLRHKQGSKAFLKVHAVADRDEHGRNVGFYACTSDSSAERIAREALRQERERQNGGAGERFARAGHDLRTPLASVIGALELVREFSGHDPDFDPDGLVAIALTNADRLALVVEQLLEQERIEAKSMPQPADL